MRTMADEWKDQEVDRGLARQQSQVDTAKVVAAFAAGTAGAVVATVAQVKFQDGLQELDKRAILTSGIAAVLALLVLLFDRRHIIDHTKVQTSNPTDPNFGNVLRDHCLTVLYFNEFAVRDVKILLWLQVTTSLIAGLFATQSLLN